MNFKTFLFLLGMFCISYGCLEQEIVFSDQDYGCTSYISTTHPDSNVFQSYLDSVVNLGIPGISMLIETPQGIWTGASGVADIENQVPMKACNVHRVGSITKMFTAISILQLWEADMLSLDDPITMYIDSFQLIGVKNAEQATIRHLLSHTSGIADYTDNVEFWLDTYDDHDKVWTAAEELSYVIDLEPELVFDSGDRVTYSNTNYLLLGMIVELVSGKSGSAYFRDHIYQPLGLQSTYFSQDGSSIPNLVRGYHDEYGDGSIRDFTDNAFAVHSMAGGIASNVEDLHTFLTAALTPGVLLASSTINEMIQPLDIPRADTKEFDFGKDNKVRGLTGIGLGWFTLDTEYGPAIGHNGGFNGRRARMWYFPERESTIIYLFNGSSFKDISRSMFRNETLELMFE